ncbi:hypothetical protein ACX5K5_00755 [Glutamicibacter bergerei]
MSTARAASTDCDHPTVLRRAYLVCQLRGHFPVMGDHAGGASASSCWL